MYNCFLYDLIPNESDTLEKAKCEVILEEALENLFLGCV